MVLEWRIWLGADVEGAMLPSKTQCTRQRASIGRRRSGSQDEGFRPGRVI